VDGLPLNEFRVLGEKCSASPDMRDEKNRRMEFATNPVTILNSLENMGYKVVTSGSFVSGQSVMTSSDKFCNREFIWTLHRFTLTLIVILGMVMVIFLDSIETNILLFL